MAQIYSALHRQLQNKGAIDDVNHRWAMGGGANDMSLFVGTYTNKIDRKGRVSVPASFRAVRLANGDAAFYGFPSVDPVSENKVIECCGESHINALRQEMKNVDVISDRYKYLSYTLRHSRELSLDAEGRVLLHSELIAFIDCEEQVTFQGQGDYFYITAMAEQDALADMNQGINDYITSLRQRKGAAKNDQ